jgi:hypothetical protein
MCCDVLFFMQHAPLSCCLTKSTSFYQPMLLEDARCVADLPMQMKRE